MLVVTALSDRSGFGYLSEQLGVYVEVKLLLYALHHQRHFVNTLAALLQYAPPYTSELATDNLHQIAPLKRQRLYLHFYPLACHPTEQLYLAFRNGVGLAAKAHEVEYIRIFQYVPKISSGQKNEYVTVNKRYNQLLLL